MTDKKEKRIADYLLAGLPVPEHLKESLIRELCEEYKKDSQRAQHPPSKIRMGGL